VNLKNALSKDGSTYAEGGEVRVIVHGANNLYVVDEGREVISDRFTSIDEAVEWAEDEGYNVVSTPDEDEVSWDDKNPSTYAEGGGIEGNYFEGDLAFLNW
jgi:hypothetical protein